MSTGRPRANYSGNDRSAIQGAFDKTTFRISSSGAALSTPSVFTGNVNAFESFTTLADTLIVDADAFLISANTFGIGAFLEHQGAWTVTVNGNLFGFDGLFLEGGNLVTSAITVGAEGSIGGTNEVITAASSATIKNSGLIFGVHNGIDVLNGATHSIMNAGVIQGDIEHAIRDQSAASNDTITNTGTIIGNVDLHNGNDSLTNSGILNGFVDLGEGTNTLTNSGDITGVDAHGISVLGRIGADTVSNTKFIAGAILIGDVNGVDTFANTLTNSGTIGKNVFDLSFGGGLGIDKVTNTGTMLGLLAMGNGANTLINSGRIGATTSDNLSYLGGIDADTVTNTGNLKGGINLNAGTNVLNNSGHIGIETLNHTSYQGDVGSDTVTNSGVMDAGVFLGAGVNGLTNSGSIGSDGTNSVISGANVDTLVNSGTISGGVSLGDGNDVFTNFMTTTDATGVTIITSGKVGGIIDLGTGNDTFNGGANAETVKDGDGADVINLRGGNDIYIATGNTGIG